MKKRLVSIRIFDRNVPLAPLVGGARAQYKIIAGKPFDLLRAVSGSVRLTAMNLPNGLRTALRFIRLPCYRQAEHVSGGFTQCIVTFPLSFSAAVLLS
jgi:hypothetical protein